MYLHKIFQRPFWALGYYRNLGTWDPGNLRSWVHGNFGSTWNWEFGNLGTQEVGYLGTLGTHYTLLLILLNKIQNISVAMATPATPLTPSLLPARKMHFLPSTHNSSVLSLRQIVLLWLLAKTDQTKKNSNSWFFHAIFFIEFRTSILESELLKNTTTTIRKSKPSPIFFWPDLKELQTWELKLLLFFDYSLSHQADWFM